MNLQKLLQEFNPSKFVVYNCLLVFTMLFALRLDETIKISYWLVFMPLFVWKSLTVSLGLIGTYIWLTNQSFRLTNDLSYIHFKSMLISLSIQLLLLMFELLSCDKLESGRNLWVIACSPLIFISLLSISICFWAMKNDRSFELELFFSVNIIQFIFIALRLDRFINWSWTIVFVPSWICMCLSIIGCLYALIFFLILLRSPEVGVEQRKASLHTAVSYSLVCIPFLIFLFLLANKLDSSTPILHRMMPHLNLNFVVTSSSLSNSFQEMSYFTVCIPLYFVFIILICLSFGSKGNSWTCGLRKDFATFLLSTCPCLKTYANISYNKQTPSSNNSSNSSNSESTSGQLENNNVQQIDTYKYKINKNQPKINSSIPIMPSLTLDQPD